MNIIQRWIQLLIRLWVSLFEERMNIQLFVGGIIGYIQQKNDLVLLFYILNTHIRLYANTEGPEMQTVPMLLNLSTILPIEALPHRQDLVYK